MTTKGYCLRKTGRTWYIGPRIDGAFDFAPILADRSDTLVVNLREVESISSIGVRQLGSMVVQILGSGKSLTLEECAIDVVDTFNLMNDLGTGRSYVDFVKSFCAPYVCKACGTEMTTVLNTSEVAVRLVKETSSPAECSRCGRVAHLAVDPRDYFHFIDRVANAP